MSDHSAQLETGDSTSRSLLRRAKEHDPVAWQRLTDLYGPLVYQWCRQFGLQACDGADVVQEVFRAVVKAIDGFCREGPDDSFRAWLWTITRSKFHDFQRRQARQVEGPGGTTAFRNLQQLPDMAPEDSDDASRQHVHAELAERALALMQSDFEERTWQAFWHTAVLHQTAAQAAADLGMSVAAVYMAKSRVLRRLREELDGLDPID